VQFIRVANEDVVRNALDVATGIALVVAEMQAEFDKADNENSVACIAGL